MFFNFKRETNTHSSRLYLVLLAVEVKSLGVKSSPSHLVMMMTTTMMMMMMFAHFSDEQKSCY